MEAVKPEHIVRFYEFGPFLVDVNKSVLIRDGEIVPLGLKAFEVLLMLLQHPGQVLKKEELLKQIWPDTVVEENNLARTISALRKALDEHPNKHQYILTVPGRGYRFVADVKEADIGTEGLGESGISALRGHSDAANQAANGNGAAPA